MIILVVASLCGGSPPARAELDAGDYAVGATPSAGERERLQRAIAAEREAETAREKARQAAEAEARERVAEAETRRPREERLLDARCTKCHTIEQVLAARHTPIGWWFTVARMRWWNGAAMTGDEAALLVAHLVQTQPARGAARLTEYSLAVFAVTFVPGAVLLHRLRRRRWRGRVGADRSVGVVAACVLAATLLLSPPHVVAADTTTPERPIQAPSGESVPQIQPARAKETASGTPIADTPPENGSPPVDDRPSDSPSMGLCSGQ